MNLSWTNSHGGQFQYYTGGALRIRQCYVVKNLLTWNEVGIESFMAKFSIKLCMVLAKWSVLPSHDFSRFK